MINASPFTFNWPLFGNKHIIDFLQGSIAGGKVSHCYIFSGRRDVGKQMTARQLAASLLCEHFAKERGRLPCNECASCRQFAKDAHSDAHWLVRPQDKQNIGIEQVRDFIRVMSMGTFMGSYKVGLIADAHHLSTEAANALLKTLEEPRAKTVIILLTSRLEQLPSTVVSRAQVLHFLPAAAGDIYDHLVETHQASRDLARKYARLSLGRPALALKFLADREFAEDVEAILLSFAGVVSPHSHERFAAIDKIWGAGGERAAARERARRILEWWQVALRDALLTSVGAGENVADNHQTTTGDAASSVETLLSVQQALERAKEYVRANVSPKLALESVALQ